MPLAASAVFLFAACGGGVSSDREAELAYLGLDLAIIKTMGLGFDGFNAASSANIDPQQTTGDHSGTLTVSGQVDQGNSDNKGMRLDLQLDEYSDFDDLDEDDDDTFAVTYWTDAEHGLPACELKLRDIPDGTFTGTLDGELEMRGDLDGWVLLEVAMEGEIEDDGQGGTQRVDGSTTITGTATGPGGGVYDIDVVR